MSDDAPVAPTESRIVTGVMLPMTVEGARIGGRAQARAGGRALVDIANAKDIAARRCGPAAEAEIGRALLKIIDEGDADIGARAQALGKAMRGILYLAEGVVSGKPNAIAVEVANGLVDPSWVLSQSGEDRMDLIVMAYAVLHLDELNRMNAEVIL